MTGKTIEELVLSERGKTYVSSCCSDYNYPISGNEIVRRIGIIPEKIRKTDFFAGSTKNYGSLDNYLKEKSITFISKLKPELKEQLKKDKLEKGFDRQAYVNASMVNEAISAIQYQTLEGKLEMERRELAFLYAVDAFLRHI